MSVAESWLAFPPCCSRGELRDAAGPEVRQVLADAGLDRLVMVFGSLAEALPNREPPLEPGLPGMASPSRCSVDAWRACAMPRAGPGRRWARSPRRDPAQPRRCPSRPATR